MKKSTLISILAILALTACDKKPADKPVASEPVKSTAVTLPPGHPLVNTNGMAMASAVPAQIELTQKATVVSAIDVPQFTYLEVTQNNQNRWLAASTIAAKKGDVILFDDGSTMTNFTSKALNRTFPSITFVNRASIANGK